MRCAILGSGNIGTDLMMKLLKGTDASGSGTTPLELVALVGIDPESDGLARARRIGIAGPHGGPQWILDHADGIDMIFDATSAYVHKAHSQAYMDAGIVAVDLTPAAIGPKVIAAVNLTEHLDAPNINMVTCGGQATTPMVYAVRRATSALPYAEMVSTVSSGAPALARGRTSTSSPRPPARPCERSVGPSTARRSSSSIRLSRRS